MTDLDHHVAAIVGVTNPTTSDKVRWLGANAPDAPIDTRLAWLDAALSVVIVRAAKAREANT